MREPDGAADSEADLATARFYTDLPAILRRAPPPSCPRRPPSPTAPRFTSTTRCSTTDSSTSSSTAPSSKRPTTGSWSPSQSTSREHVRRFSGVDLSLADATDDELRADVEAYVDERIARYEAAKNDRERAFASVLGSLGYGPADAPREEQVAQGMEERTRRRAYEREVRAAIERLDTEDDATD